MEVRQLNEADGAAYRYPRLRALQEAPGAFAETYEETVGRDTTYYAQLLRTQEDGAHAVSLGAFVGGALIGVVTLLQQRATKTRHKALMVAMYVTPERRGQGIGRTLVEAVLQRAREMPGLEQVQTTVVTTNAPARHLYHSVGFAAYGRERHALKEGDEAWDEELLVLHLDQQEQTGGA